MRATEGDLTVLETAVSDPPDRLQGASPRLRVHLPGCILPANNA
jgi:hypothetical protein